MRIISEFLFAFIFVYLFPFGSYLWEDCGGHQSLTYVKPRQYTLELGRDCGIELLRFVWLLIVSAMPINQVTSHNLVVRLPCANITGTKAIGDPSQ